MKKEDTFPFWIMTLREYYIWLIDNNGEQTPELKRYKASLNPGNAGGVCNSFVNNEWAQRYGNGGYHFTNQVLGARNFETYTIRILPPMGWLTLSDMMVSTWTGNWANYINDTAYRRYTHTDGNTYDIGPRNIFEREIIFVKKDPLYAIPCDGLYQTYQIDNGVNGSPCESRFGIDATNLGTNFFINTNQKDTWLQERTTCYKLTCSNPSYISPGSRWGNYWGHTLDLYGAVNRVYLETVSYKINKDYGTWYDRGGALLSNSNGTKKGCKYTAWSTVAYYDRTGKKNGNILDEKADSTIEPGKLTYTSVFMASWGEYDFEWNANFEGDGPARVLYLLHFEATNRLCCAKPESLAPGECGYGTNAISPSSTQCADLYRKLCKADSPYFTTNYCLKNGCRKDVKDNTNLIVCDYEYKKFCNYIEDPAIPNAEKSKLLNDRAPYQSIVDDCALYNESFPGFTYTTDKKKIYDDMCSNPIYKDFDPTTGKITPWNYTRINAMQNMYNDLSGISLYGGGDIMVDPVRSLWNDYCSNGGKYYDAFQRWYSSKPNCENAKVVADEFNSRIGKVDVRLADIQQSNAMGKSVNLLKYPDICSCYASTKTLKDDCNTMADVMNIRNNKAAKKVLNIDTDDPLQCTQNCAVNTLCRQQTVPSNAGYPSDRVGRYVQKGYIQDKGTCEDKNLCIQTATVNAQGKIGSLTINQTANCSAYKSKFCQNSVLSKCDTQNGQGLFVKRVIEDKDGGTCTGNLDSLQCANITLTPIYDSKCVNGFRSLAYRQTRDNVNTQDVIDALNTLLTAEMKTLNPKVSYDPALKVGTIITNCQNCEVDFEAKSPCYLDNGNWKLKATKTKVVKQPLNGGTACQVDNSIQVTDCSTDIACVVSTKTPDSGCVSGKRTMTFNIDSFNSGNGKSCNDAVLEKLPQLFKDNAASVDISGKTATASINCRDCVVDYKIDPSSNNGKCYFDGTKTVIKKIPFIKKQAINGGKCDVKLDTPMINDCEFDQDCSFNDEPSNEASGLCINKERTLEFDVKMPSLNNGKSCAEVAKTFGSKYTKDTSKNIFLNNKLYIKTTCEKPQDCELETIPYQVGCDINTGKGVEMYKILSPQKIGGKTCTEVATELFPENNIIESSTKITVEKPCIGIPTITSAIKSDKRSLYYIIFAVIFILIVIATKVF